MPRRKATPKPKRKASRKSGAPVARTSNKAQQDTIAAAAQQVARALNAEQSKVIAELAARAFEANSHRIRDLAAKLKALAEQPTEWAVVMPRAERVALPHNLTAARVNSPDLVPAGRAVQMGVDTYRDYLELPTRYLYSPEAERLLSVLAGKWREAYYSAGCNADRGQHAADCAHLERRIVVSKRSLARELHGSAGGSQVAMVSKCLRELASARHYYSKARTSDGSDAVQLLSSADGEPILTYARLSESDSLESAAATRSLTLLLGERLHAQLMQGFYRIERTERLTCWRESWELELMLRILSSPATRYGSHAMNHSSDGLSLRLLLGRTDDSTELGSIESLLGGSRSLRSPKTTTARLRRFEAQLRAVSKPDELQVVQVKEQVVGGRVVGGKVVGGRVVGWYLGLTYPEPPLTAGQVKRLASSARRKVKTGDHLTRAEQRALAKVQAYPKREATPVEQALAALSATTSGTKRTRARHEVPQITHETAPRLVADSYLDSTQAKSPEGTNSTTLEEKAPRFEGVRSEWWTYSYEVRRTLRERHPEELGDLPLSPQSPAQGSE